MTDRILIKRSLTSGSIPSTASLEAGELAINVPDGKLFLKQSGSNIEQIKSLLTLDTPMSGNILLTGSITTIGNSTSISGSLFGTASWATNAISASYAPSTLPDGLLSSSTQVDYTQIQNTPSTIATASYIDYNDIANLPSLVSSSTQINTGSFSGNFIGTSSWAESSSIAINGIITASAANTTITFIKGDGTEFSVTIAQSGSVESASYAAVAETATSASYSVTASYVDITGLPEGIISSSTQVDYTQLQNIPVGIVSSSLQINTGSFSGSFTGTLIGTSSWSANAISSSFSTTASAATSITFVPATASFAVTASYVSGAASDWDSVANKPVGLVSSSTQINTGSFSGSFTGNLIGTSSWATSASYAPTILPTGTISSSTQVDYTQIQNKPTTVPTASYVDYINVANIPTLISSSTQVNYTQLQNIPVGIVSSSAQVTTLLPTGTVSSSLQINTGSFSGSFTGTLLGTSSWALNATTASAATSITFIPATASFATSASYAPTVLPSGVISSSAQVNYTQLQNIPSGIVSSSAQINTGSFSGSFAGALVGTSSWANNATSASYAPTILPNGTVSSSAQVDYAQLQNIPSGIVSSSAQINTGSFSGSFTGTLIGTSSWANNATSASYAPPSFIDNFVTVGLIGSDTQYNSIKTAVDSITDASVNNTYTVKVYPGIYIEDTITLTPYIAIKGESSTSTIVSASNPSSSIFIMADQTMVIDMQIQGSTAPNVSAVVYSSPTTPQTNAIAYVENVRFGTNYTNAKVIGSGSSGNCILQCSNVKYGGFTDSSNKSFDVGFYVTSGSDGGIGRMQLRNVTSTNGGVAGTDNDQIFALADAPGCTFIVNGCLLTRSTGTARGTGFKVYNGGQLRLTGVNFQRWIRGIWAPQTGSAPNIDAIALNFENCTTDVAIEHTGSLGKVQGTDNFLKTQIALDAPLYEVGQDPRKISVAKKGGDFSSISASVAYITDSNEDNRYVIEVGPGQYTENMIDLTGKPYVSIVGSNIQTTEIFPSQSNHPIIKMGINNEISFLTLAGAGSGQAAIYVDDVGDFAQAHKISIYDSDIGVYVNASTTDTQFYGEYIDINGTFTYGAYVSSSNGATSQCNLENYYLFPSTSAAIGNYAVGPSSSLSLYTTKYQGDGTTGSIAIKLENGSELESTGLDIQDSDYGLVIPAGGNGPNFRIVGGMIHESATYDFDIQNANTRGRYQGVSNHVKINNNSENFYWNFLDDEDGENDVTRKLSVTFADGTHTDATTLIFNGSPMGVMSGGEITISSGLTITTAAGFGYCENPLDNGIYKRIDWNNSNITLSANTNNYIYINYNGILSAAGSAPSSLENIILGRVVTNDTGVEFIDQTPYDGAHMSNKISKFNREALGPVFAEGSIVSENVTPFKLDVTQGSYFFSENNFLPVGTSSVNLTQYYQSASVWARYTSSVVPNNVYASASILTPMSSSYYTKHTVYLVGDGVDEEYFLVINNNQYSSLVATENADLPTIPTYFNDGVVPLAAVYVQSGSANITQIQDIRPIIGFRAAGVNASSVHGNLLGLSADDHTQYLLVNGGRAMAGDLSLGGNDITNVGTIFGTASWATDAINAITASAATSITFIPTSASFATSASYAPTILPIGVVSSSTQVNYAQLQNIPSGIVSSSTQVTTLLPAGTVSSSTQINTGSFSGSFTGNFIGTSSWANNATSASYAPTILPSGTISSSAQVDYTQLQNIPAGIVSSSTQINTGSFSGSFTGTLIGTSSWSSRTISASFATSASWAPTGLSGGSANYIPLWTSATAQSSSNIYQNAGNIGIGTTNPNRRLQVSGGSGSGVLSSAAVRIDNATSGRFAIAIVDDEQNLHIWNSNEDTTPTAKVIFRAGPGSGLVTAQIDSSGSISASLGISASLATITNITASNISGRLIGQHTGSTFGTSSWANNVISASFATTASAATSITFIPTSASYAVSASWAQSSSVAISASFAPITLPTGVISSSTQVNYTQLQNIPAGIVSSSTQVVALLPTGTVSSSLQINTGSFSGSFTGNFIGTSSWSSNTISSSFATTASAATSITFTPTTASFATTSSFAVSSSWAPTTSTFPFIGNAVISGSLVVSGSASSSLTVNSDRITVVGSASFTGPISGAHAAFSQMYNENSTVAGVYLGRNTTDNTPRIGFFNGTSAENWQIDNNGGQFRWYTPSVTRLTLTSSGVNAVLRLLGSGSVITSEGSISASNGITGSLLGTASNATSASFASIASFVNILNQTVSASGNIEAGTNLVSNNSSGDEGGEILLAKPQTNSTIAGTGVTIDVYQNKLRIFEQGGAARGGYWDITSLGAGVGTNLAGGAGTVTSVTAGDGLSGGTITGAGTIAIDTGSAHFITGSISAINLKGVVSSSTQINTGSFSGSFTGILIGTSSWANNATSASFATTASFALNAGAGSGFPFSGSAVITGSLLVSGSGLQVTGSTTVLGAFQATTKSFKIDHQRIAGKSLIYGVLEGAEHAVYARGRTTSQFTGTAIIQLPEEWEWLVDENTITVQLTPIGGTQGVYVDAVENNTVILKSKTAIDCFYLVHATRKDVEPLQTVQ